MKYAASPLLFSVGSYAAAIKQSQCYFELEASGGALGFVGQTNNGYSRIGGDRSPTTYYISNGVITDSTGHGYFSPWANSDFGPDKDKSDATHSGFFSIGADGKLFYNGNNKFYACPAEKGEYDIRTYSDGHAKCVDVTFSTNGKCASGEYGYDYDKHGHANLKRDDTHGYGDKKYHDGAHGDKHGYGDKKGDDDKHGYGDKKGDDKRGYGDDAKDSHDDKKHHDSAHNDKNHDGGKGSNGAYKRSYDDTRHVYGDKKGDNNGGHGDNNKYGYGDDKKYGYGGDKNGGGDKKNGGGDKKNGGGDKKNGGGDKKNGGDDKKNGYGGDDKKNGYGGDDKKNGYGGGDDNKHGYGGGDDNKHGYGGGGDKKNGYGGDDNKHGYGGDDKNGYGDNNQKHQ